MTNKIELDVVETYKRKVDAFMKRQDFAKSLRRNAVRNYHPDRLQDDMKKLGEEILSRINDVCDKLEK